MVYEFASTSKITYPGAGISVIASSEENIAHWSKLAGVQNDLLPVRSNQPLPKEKLFDCMDVIRATSVKLPVNRYDVIIPNICGTGVDIVATKNVG